MSQVAQELRALRLQAQLSLSAMARELGWGLTRYQHYEDRYKREQLPPEVLDAVVPVLRRHGVPDRDLLRIGWRPEADAEAVARLLLQIDRRLEAIQREMERLRELAEAPSARS